MSLVDLCPLECYARGNDQPAAALSPTFKIQPDSGTSPEYSRILQIQDSIISCLESTATLN
jgi:hypothetical protein